MLIPKEVIVVGLDQDQKVGGVVGVKAASEVEIDVIDVKGAKAILEIGIEIIETDQEEGGGLPDQDHILEFI